MTIKLMAIRVEISLYELYARLLLEGNERLDLVLFSDTYD